MTNSTTFNVEVEGSHLVAERWDVPAGAGAATATADSSGTGDRGEPPGHGSTGEAPAPVVVVLLHAGVADRRSWYDVAPILAAHDTGGAADAAAGSGAGAAAAAAAAAAADSDAGTDAGPTTSPGATNFAGATVIAYDRRGHGESPPPTEHFSQVDDLLAVVNAVTDGAVWLVGNSMGGAISLETALMGPDWVAGLVLIGTGVGGAPQSDPDPDSARLWEMAEAAFESGDMEEVNRLETWVWLDGPAQPEGRVAGQARELFLDMNGIVLSHVETEELGISDVAAWDRLHEIDKPVTVLCGEFDVPIMLERSAEIARRIPGAHNVTMAGVAHVPSLEQPAEVARLIAAAIRP
jgi:pimeloyl-ACP methyl ester carboxylesterase